MIKHQLNIKMNISYPFVLLCFVFFYQIPAFLTILIAYPFGVLARYFNKQIDHTKFTNYLVRIGLYLTDKSFFRIEHVIDPSVTDLSKRQIYLMNHQSYIDPILGGVFKNKIIIPVAGYLKYVPVIGYNAIFTGAPLVTFIKGGDRSKGTTQKLINILSQDTEASLSLFPEGQRNFHDDIKFDELKTGGFVVAKETGMNIVPVYHNIMDRFDDDKYEYHNDKKIFCIWGKPIEVQGKDIAQLHLEYFESMRKLRSECFRLRNKEIDPSLSRKEL